MSDELVAYLADRRAGRLIRKSNGNLHVREVVALLRETTAVPAQELPRVWEALVFNWLIGNCDAHGKNYSLLYDAGAPTLAPLYDLVSTTAYHDLTTRLAMRVDGAADIGEVSAEAWGRLAAEVGVRRPDLQGAQPAIAPSAGSPPVRRSQGRWRRRAERIARVAGERLSV